MCSVLIKKERGEDKHDLCLFVLISEITLVQLIIVCCSTFQSPINFCKSHQTPLESTGVKPESVGVAGF